VIVSLPIGDWNIDVGIEIFTVPIILLSSHIYLINPFLSPIPVIKIKLKFESSLAVLR
jgi:hypothetical protein